jgi:cellulose biosynthesis protein BcsQ
MTLSDPVSETGSIVTFYSSETRLGRTSALANIAWILASNGKRVLAVDWDLTSPGLNRYFRPFLDPNQASAPRGIADVIAELPQIETRSRGLKASHGLAAEFAVLIRQYVQRLDLHKFPGSGTIDLLGPGGKIIAPENLTSTSGLAGIHRRLIGTPLPARLAEAMRGDYDYILIDSADGLAAAAGVCTVELPDTLVACFRMNPRSIAEMAAIASSIRDQRAARLLRFLPVPMLVEDGEIDQLNIGRSHARRKLDSLLDLGSGNDHALYWAEIEMPYKPYYSGSPALAAFGDSPGSPASLLSFYERLASRLTGTSCFLHEPIPDSLRSRYRDELFQYEEAQLTDLPIGAPSVEKSQKASPRVFISYVREDSDIVDRIAGELRSHDIGVWLDRTSLEVGDRWKEVVREAIRNGDYFLACFSPAYDSRGRTYMNEELIIAVQELRLRPRDRRWFLPITLGSCRIPHHPISAAETLEDIHCIDFTDDWERAIARLIRVLT